MNIASQLGRLLAIEVSRHSPLNCSSVDWQNRQVDRKRTKEFQLRVIAESIAAVVDREITTGDDVSDIRVSSLFIIIQLFVRSGNRVNLETTTLNRILYVNGNQALGGRIAVGVERTRYSRKKGLTGYLG